MSTQRPHGMFCWNELGTRDPDGAARFYSELFGWTFDAQDMGDHGTYWMLRLGADDLGGMYQLAGPMFEGVPPHWAFYVSVPDVDAAVAKSNTLGGSVTMPPMDVPNVGRIAGIQDPTGARLALFQPGAHGGATFDPMAANGISWVELSTPDAATARAFYTALFGWEAKADDGPMPYTEFSLPGSKQFAGMIELGPEMLKGPPCWLGYVMVEDCDATLAKATTLGARPLMPVREIRGVGRFAVVADPQGAVFAFIALAPHGA